MTQQMDQVPSPAFREWLDMHRKTTLILALAVLFFLWPLGLILDLLIDDTEY